MLVGAGVRAAGEIVRVRVWVVGVLRVGGGRGVIKGVETVGEGGPEGRVIARCDEWEGEHDCVL